MHRRIAVLNNRHLSSFKTIAFMLDSIGFDVYDAGESFKNILFPAGSPHPNEYIKGVIEFEDLPPDALFVDPRWQNEIRLREAGWNGPFLIYWLTPEHPDNIREILVPLYRTASLVFRPRMASMLSSKGIPVDCFWPPYAGDIDRTPRETFEDYFVFACKDAGYCVHPSVLAVMRDSPDIKLRLFGGGMPQWSKLIPYEDLLQQVRKSIGMCHLKHIDNCGNTLMEAMWQGVPVIVTKGYIQEAEADDLLDPNETCVMINNPLIDDVREACIVLKDQEFNKKVGEAGRRRLEVLSDWRRNRPRFINLVSRIL